MVFVVGKEMLGEADPTWILWLASGPALVLMIMEHMDRAAASPEHTQKLCWSTWTSSSLGADAGAPLEHMEQWLPWSTESSYAVACGAAAL